MNEAIRCDATDTGSLTYPYQRGLRGKRMGEILVGTTSWTEQTLMESGRFYPRWANSAEARLKYYASQFPLVEVDSTYYALPSERTAKLWTTRTPNDFIFDVKAFRLLTHHPTQLSKLPRDLRDAVPEAAKEKKNIYYRDLPADMLTEVWQRFESALLPLDTAGKLGVVLLQFPPWFMPRDDHLDFIESCRERLPQYRIAVEFRHWSWVNEKNLDRTMGVLRENNMSFVCVDEPQGFKSSVPAVVEATSDIGVVRFHGRNMETWEKDSKTAAERFDYLYTEEEMQEWVPRIRQLASQTKQVHVLFNNCYADKAVVNAGQMKSMLD
ncbi:MAG: DUF72 domain-containing protein [Chloroflexota bacterium]